MSSAAIQDIDLKEFMSDPYPTLKYFRKNSPIAYVPQLNATLFSKHQDIFICEKNVEIFSSVQPDGLMTKLMGQNMKMHISRNEKQSSPLCLLKL